MNKKEQRAADKAAKLAAQAAADAMVEETAPGKTDTPPVETKAAKARKPKAEPKAQTVTLADGTVKTLVAIPQVKRARKPKPSKACSCGCGGQTKGGRFIPGHDSRLHSWCRAVEKGLVKLADIPDGERQAVEAHMQPKAAKA